VKDFFVLKLLDKLRFLFNRSGIDYKVMRRILQLKLTLDGRRVPTIMMNSKKTEGKGSYRTGLLIYGIMGLFIALVMLFGFPVFFKMNMVLGLIIFMVMTTMISDFSAVLLDINDKNILVPRPVSPQTINAAKLIHIIIYMSNVTLMIAGPTLVAGTFIYGGLFILIFLPVLVLICGFVIFLTSILYSAILRLFDGEKLKDIINYFQILLSVFMVVAYQFMGRIFNIVDLRITFTPKWWDFILPSAWFAAPFEVFMGHGSTAHIRGLCITGIIIPAAALIIYIKAVMPHFERVLQKLNNNSGGNKISVRKERRQRVIAKWACGDKMEECFYRFTRNILTNERKLKLRLYPNLALAVVFPFVFMMNSIKRGSSFSEFLAKVSSGKSYLYLYVSIALLATLLQLMSTSEQYKGAWIYRALPIASPAPVIKGAVKGFMLKYLFPAFFLVSLIFTVIYGIRIIPDIMLIFFNMILLALLIFVCSGKELPFYKDFQYSQNGNNVGIVFLSMFICGLSALVHLFASSFSYGVVVYLAVSILLTAVVWKFSFKITWKNVLKGSS
jgi:hypothetical protein